jgi:hypothetical protein
MDKKSIWAHHKKMRLFPRPFFFPSRLFCSIFYRVLGRFVTRGVQTRDKKIMEIFLQPPKKVLTYAPSCGKMARGEKNVRWIGTV